jgi:hypothetical protein
MTRPDYRKERTALLRSMADKYRRLAKATHDPQDRRKFLDYAATYAALAVSQPRYADCGDDKERGR